MSDVAYLVFFETWFHLAEGRDTDAKRLAFYDTIMRYAFEGVEPEKPVKGSSPGEAWAAWDAFVLSKDKIDCHHAKVRAGQAGRGVSRKHIESIMKAELKQDESKTEAEDKAKTDINKNKNRSKNKRDISGGRPPALSQKLKDIRSLFDLFWAEYPSTCPRKYDKRKCVAKWEHILRGAEDPDALFSAIMEGLAKWKHSAMWNEADGRYIKAPLVWLNGECWEDAPREDASPASAEDQQAKMDRIAEPIIADLKRKGLM